MFIVESRASVEKPMVIMTSYNKVNGVHAVNHYDLCTTAARQEWAFAGIIMADWTTTNNGHGASVARCIAVENELVMPGRLSDIQEIVDAVQGEKHLRLAEEDLNACAARMPRIIFASKIYKKVSTLFSSQTLFI